MLKEIREALKAEVALVVPIRAKIRNTTGRERYDAWNEKRDDGTRRSLHLAACYVRGTPYRKCEANPETPPSARRIRDLLVKYGCVEDVEQSVDSWLDVAPVPVAKPPRVERLYIVVRADLPPGAQAVQAAHAMREFAELHPEIEKAWHAKSNTVAMLSVPDEAALLALVERLHHPWGKYVPGLALAEFREPDLGGALTAICVEPKAERALRHLPLALRASAA